MKEPGQVTLDDYDNAGIMRTKVLFKTKDDDGSTNLSEAPKLNKPIKRLNKLKRLRNKNLKFRFNNNRIIYLKLLF